MGATIAVAMEAGLANFGDAEAATRMVKEVGQGTPLGRILGAGAAVTGQVFGVERVPVVKGQAMPAYDPRAVQGGRRNLRDQPNGGRPYRRIRRDGQHPGCRRQCRSPQARRPGGIVAQSANRHGGHRCYWHVRVHRPLPSWTSPKHSRPCSI